MKPDYMDNRRELRKITDTLDVMNADKNISIRQIKIHGWASPESPYKHNEMLANNRAKSLTDYVRRTYNLPADVFAPAEATPENWVGLREAVEQLSTATLPHRDAILSIIDDVTLEPDPKEKRIKQRYPSEYQYLLRNVYPHLRRSDYEITFQYKEFTLEEAKEVYKTKPYQLSLRELWDVAQTFPKGGDEYNKVMQTAANIYPDSPEAAINLANVALRQNDLLKAETLLEHAGTSAEAENARAILYMKKKEWLEAEYALRRAETAGMDVKVNRGVLQVLQEQKK
jgi:tetratricopeptide (TPR) repeat protein